MSWLVKEIQPTPNPNALKLVLDRQIAAQPLSFLNPSQAQGHPLASELFAVAGVTSVLLLGDFVTINKQPEAKWEKITPRVQEILQKAPDEGRF